MPRVPPATSTIQHHQDDSTHRILRHSTKAAHHLSHHCKGHRVISINEEIPKVTGTMLAKLPLELQLLTLSHVYRLDDLVHLYDALQLPCPTDRLAQLDVLHASLVERVFMLMQHERISQHAVLERCITATEELRDTLSLPLLEASLTGILSQLGRDQANLRASSGPARLQFRNFTATEAQAARAQQQAADLLRAQGKQSTLRCWEEAQRRSALSVSAPPATKDALPSECASTTDRPASHTALYCLTDAAQLKASRYKYSRFMDRLYRTQQSVQAL